MSKNRAGGLAQLNKVVPIDVIPEAGTRCHVYVLDLYFEKIPREAIEKDNFYVQPVVKLKDSTQPWFTTVPVGRNALSKMVKDICADAGVSGNKTNHSLRATGATKLYHAGVPEKVIQERTGHLSLSGLRQYKRNNDDQQLAVSQVLSSRENTLYSEERAAVSRVHSEESSITPVACTPTITLSNCSNCSITVHAAAPQQQSLRVCSTETDFGN